MKALFDLGNATYSPIICLVIQESHSSSSYLSLEALIEIEQVELSAFMGLQLEFTAIVLVKNSMQHSL